MLRKMLAAFLVLSVVLVPQLAATSSADVTTTSETEETFTFTNVYEYDSSSYKKKAHYDTLRVTLKDELMDFDLDGTSLTNTVYTVNKNESTGTTLISASGDIDSNRHASIRLVFDEKENANGNIILTTSKKINIGGETKIIETDKLIRFAPVNEPVNLESLVNGIRSDDQYSDTYTDYGPLAGEVALASAQMPVVKSYKYSNYMYGGVFWNTNYIATGTSPMQLKFSPLMGNLYFWKNSNGKQGTIIKNQSMIISTSANYSFTSGPIGLTYPIVDNPNNPKNVTIKLSYKGAGVGVTFPLGSNNSISNGSNASWKLNKQYTDFLNKNGSELDAYYLEGTTNITGAGKTTSVSSSATVKIGALYYFGDIPAQDVVFTDSFSIPSFTASVVSE
ncbi:hypothetical protein Q9R46_05685 [Paenibacillus sp. RRE4]|uniref:hypothetical protein n=1 Tax=Paenibacillus sp. RRE4 TaxID=2962587 RepID=UPI0028816758|nr:hypothetical protein [Paenibacillus sp. RRE4]MDT0122118.1 hypothetical protein [Paenibacillus sp. RRE4]